MSINSPEVNLRKERFRNKFKRPRRFVGGVPSSEEVPIHKYQATPIKLSLGTRVKDPGPYGVCSLGFIVGLVVGIVFFGFNSFNVILLAVAGVILAWIIYTLFSWRRRRR